MTPDILEKQWNAYLDAYGALDRDARERLLADSVSEAVVFTNPGGEGHSRKALIAHIEDFQAKMPGMYFASDRVYFHHGELLAVWSMYKSDDTKVATGYNFVRLDEQGRFTYMAGFF